ncbi:MAG TPA: M14 family metallopeptidase [Gemmatimonadaceae bacterium]|nr:M14 family metallopeptidase [Gemmatimonadaceae bacterium]
MNRQFAVGAFALAALLAPALVSAQGTPKPAVPAAATAAGWPQTRAERSNYKETSTYQDVVDFVDSLQAKAAGRVWVGSIGRTTEGRDLPFIVASRPLVTTPAEAKRLRRPIVYVQGNIHAGEVEGKEALQAVVRDLVMKAGPSVLDSIVLVAVPIYNADGNERFAPQARNRGAQNGPEMVGQRPNAKGFDLNRDYIKAEAPETRASLAMFNAWDPDVFVDLHTTDGSMHGYALTYSPSLNPAAGLASTTFGGAFARDSLLPVIRRRMQAKYNFPIFDYGNFGEGCANPGRGGDPTAGGRGRGAGGAGAAGGAGRGAGRGGDSSAAGAARGGAGGGGGRGRGAAPDTMPTRWCTYEHLPRYGTNYYGLRGRVSILSEAYSHDPFERRVKSTYAFVQEILSIAAEKRASILGLAERSDRNLAQGMQKDVPIRSQMTQKPLQLPVSFEVILQRAQGDTARLEPGISANNKRTGRFKSPVMSVYDRFDPTLTIQAPMAYLIPAIGADSAVALLRLHGVVVERLRAGWTGDGESFTVDTISKGSFSGSPTTRVAGHWSKATVDAPAGAYVVRTSQPLGVLAVYLLEPESDDGLSFWHHFDALLSVGREHPVARIRAAVTAPAWIVP